MIRKRTAVLISGKGSNLKALIEAARAPDFPAEIALVISSRPQAPGLTYATAAEIPCRIIPAADYPDRDVYDAALHDALTEAGIEIVCLAGFMRILTPGFVERWRGRMINIHPSLLPKYKGLNTHARALEAGDSEAGCTAHFVTPELDSGPVILQAHVPVLPGDTPEILAGRVLEQEHKIYAQALRLVAAGEARL